MSIQRFQALPGRLSHALVHNGIVYITGQVPRDVTRDVAGQTAEVLARVDELLAEAGSDKSHILFAQIWLKHVVKDFDAMNSVWKEWIPHDALPARATVEANLANEGILVEISLQAAVKA
ncbi:RidA family protein [Pseudomonas sp. JM0905a]|uniref:RidA family protein n=1 Tax=Pseudomonas sp. JM0905a TaxID=2772484 RepID=UPI001689B460|nr:RidA family protein [Pseudomonas sp. JM0905a]MBD2837825.1 RidA family protein [Pseudomonas sp. JM0905a]